MSLEEEENEWREDVEDFEQKGGLIVGAREKQRLWY